MHPQLETRGPPGYREASCGTLTFYEKDGDRLESHGFGCMQEHGKPEQIGVAIELPRGPVLPPGVETRNLNLAYRRVV